MTSTKILHVISSLNTGGAELHLLRLIKQLPKEKFTNIVISLTGKGTLSKFFEENNIKVINLDFKKSTYLFLLSLIKFFLLKKKIKTDIILGWMYHGMLASFFLKYLIFKNSKLIWSIRQTLYDIKNEKKITSLVIRLLCYLSSSANKIIYNSFTSKTQHEELGFCPKDSIVIHNNVDLKEFQIQKTNMVNKLVFNIFKIARFHPMKNHDLMIKTAFLVLSRLKNVKFYMIGKNVCYKNNFFKNKIGNKIFKKDIILIDEIEDIRSYYKNCDLLISTSAWGEGFPNVIAESSVQGIPCIATNTGDTNFLVLEKKLTVRRNISPLILSEKIIKIIKQTKKNNFFNKALIIRRKLDIKDSVLKYTNIFNKI